MGRAITRNPDHGFAIALEPLSVAFTYPRPRSTRTHQRLLGRAILRFSQPCFRIELAREPWQAPLPSGDPELFAQRLAEARAAIHALGTQAPLPLRVEALVTPLLHRGSTAVRAALLGFANAGALRNARKRWRTSGRI